MNIINTPSKNFDDRPQGEGIQFLVLHSTECDLDMALKILTDDQSSYPVSAHYVIAQNGDIYTLVPEHKRAWHAGKDSHWRGVNRLNTTSIGIEIVNTQGNPFTNEQMQSVFHLSRDIMTRHRVKPHHVVAHSDIALGRKIDPGPLFDWKWLAEKGIGLHPDVSLPGVDVSSTPTESHLDVKEMQAILTQIGYNVSSTGQYDTQTGHALKAFQMRFRPSQIDGNPDLETTHLLLKYREILAQILS